MNKLFFHGRPWVQFDAKNRDHRQWYHNFIKVGNWSSCPVRFAMVDEHGDIVSSIERSLTEYYTKQEFAGRKK